MKNTLWVQLGFTVAGAVIAAFAVEHFKKRFSAVAEQRENTWEQY